MMRKIGMTAVCVLVGLTCAISAGAVPVLQVGAYAEDGDVGIYADYQASLTNPTEADTAVTTGNVLLVAGVYQQNAVANLGGQYDGGDDWSDLLTPQTTSGEASFANTDIFDGHGALLVASVADGQGSYAYENLEVGGVSAIGWASAPSFFPNEHDPVKDDIADFLFFDIGDFVKFDNAVPNFDESETDMADGEVKSFTIAGMGSLEWIHWDVMAIQTDKVTNQGVVVTTLENNPGSHDLTWKNDGGGDEPNEVVPEPGTILLMGSGLLGLGGAVRGRQRKV